jgi:hypothetical protein
MRALQLVLALGVGQIRVKIMKFIEAADSTQAPCRLGRARAFFLFFTRRLRPEAPSTYTGVLGITLHAYVAGLKQPAHPRCRAGKAVHLLYFIILLVAVDRPRVTAVHTMMYDRTWGNVMQRLEMLLSTADRKTAVTLMTASRRKVYTAHRKANTDLALPSLKSIRRSAKATTTAEMTRRQPTPAPSAKLMGSDITTF